MLGLSKPDFGSVAQLGLHPTFQLVYEYAVSQQVVVAGFREKMWLDAFKETTRNVKLHLNQWIALNGTSVFLLQNKQ